MSCKKAAQFYDAVANRFDQEYYGANADPCIAFDVQHVWKILRENIGENDVVLEVGCGTGYWLEKIGSEITPHVYGIDFSAGMLRYARQRAWGTLVMAEASRLPFRSEKFDVVISPYNALNHCERFQQAFQEIRRVLRIDGKALLMLDNKERLIPRYWKISDGMIESLESDPRTGGGWRHLVNGEEVEVYTHLFTQDEIRELMKGFEVRFQGIGMLSPLIPRFLRSATPSVCKMLLLILGPIERHFTLYRPGRAAHLFTVSRKVGT